MGTPWQGGVQKGRADATVGKRLPVSAETLTWVLSALTSWTLPSSRKLEEGLPC